MRLSLTYRTVAICLAAVFAVFAAGLPVIVASCPMAKVADRSCCACSETSSVPAYAPWRDASCCATVIAADRNTTEFLPQDHVHVSALLAQTVPVLAPPPAVLRPVGSLYDGRTHSPPGDLSLLQTPLLI